MSDYKFINANELPAVASVTDNDMILIIHGGRPKRALPSAMRGKAGDPGASSYLGVTATHIRWKMGVDGVWQNLISIASLIGPHGEKPIFRKVGGTLQMKYESEPDTAFVSIFDREELKMKFTDLTPAEVDLLKLHFSDLTEADKAELMKPATEAASDARTAITDLRRLESAVEKQEGIRETSYIGWQAKEQTRQTEELIRIQEEKKRNIGETSRCGNEDTRIVEEQLRLTDEKARKDAEAIRKMQEELRQTNTTEAVIAAEAAYTRLNALSSHRDVIRDGFWWRWNEETGDWYNTGLESKGDSFRYDDFTQEQLIDIKKPSVDAAREAKEAAAEARNVPKIKDGTWRVWNPEIKDYTNTNSPATGRSPKIQDGTWWVWDDSLGAYANTSVAVNSTYELTREKVENALTGDISSHNHATQLAEALAGYVQTVAGKQLSTEDFTTTLKTRLEALSSFDDTVVLEAINTINQRIDTLLGGSASSAIDTFREIEIFLAGIADTESLTGMLSDMRMEITALIPKRLSQLENDNNTVQDANYTHTDNNFTTGEKDKLSGIAANANNYVLPLAVVSTLGGVRLGYATNGKNYKVQADENGNVYVNVPWADTSYNLPTAGDSALGGVKTGYTSNNRNYKVQTDNIGNAFVAVPWTDTQYVHPSYSAKVNGLHKITVDATGHVSAVTPVVKTDITGLGIPAQDTVYTHPTGAGNNHIPIGGAANQILRWSASGVAVWSAENNTSYNPATTSANGLMTAAQFNQLAFYEGQNIVTTLINIPATKQSVLAKLADPSTLSIAGTIANGRILSIKCLNTSSIAITLPLPTTGLFVSKDALGNNIPSIVLPASGQVEINIWSLDGKYYIKTDA